MCEAVTETCELSLKSTLLLSRATLHSEVLIVLSSCCCCDLAEAVTEEVMDPLP